MANLIDKEIENSKEFKIVKEFLSRNTCGYVITSAKKITKFFNIKTGKIVELEHPEYCISVVEMNAMAYDDSVYNLYINVGSTVIFNDCGEIINY